MLVRRENGEETDEVVGSRYNRGEVDFSFQPTGDQAISRVARPFNKKISSKLSVASALLFIFLRAWILGSLMVPPYAECLASSALLVSEIRSS